MTGGGCWISRCPAVFPLSLFQPQNTDSAHMRSTKSCRYNAQPRPPPPGGRRCYKCNKTHRATGGLMPAASVCKLPGVNVSLLTDIRQMLGNEGRTCGFEPGCCLGFVSHSSPILPRPSLLPPAGSKEKKAPEWLMVDLEENLSVPLTPPTRLYLFFHLFIFCSSVVSLHCFLVVFFFCFVSTLSGSFFYHC